MLPGCVLRGGPLGADVAVAVVAQLREEVRPARKRLQPREIAWSRAKTQQAAQKCPRADIAGRARSAGYRTAPSRMAAALLSTATPVS